MPELEPTIIVAIFIKFLLNDAVISSVSVVSNGRIIVTYKMECKEAVVSLFQGTGPA
jgi:hypothetical protein